MGNRIYDSSGLSRALLTSSGEIYTVVKKDEAVAVMTPARKQSRQNRRRMKTLGEPMYTLTTKDRHGLLVRNRFRHLTPREAARLQGFSDDQFDKAAAVNSETQLFKQFGNCVSIPVIYDIALRL